MALVLLAVAALTLAHTKDSLDEAITESLSYRLANLRPIAAVADPSLAGGDPDTAQQIIAPDGRVLAATPNLSRADSRCQRSEFDTARRGQLVADQHFGWAICKAQCGWRQARTRWTPRRGGPEPRRPRRRGRGPAQRTGHRIPARVVRRRRGRLPIWPPPPFDPSNACAPAPPASALPTRMPACPSRRPATKSAISERPSMNCCNGCTTRWSASDSSSAMRATNFAPRLSLLTTELELALRRPRSNPELIAAIRSALDETTRLSRLARDLLTVADTGSSAEASANKATRTASANTIARLEFKYLVAAAYAELAHDRATAFSQDSTVQPGLKRRMAAHGVHAFLCTPLGCGPSRM